jgi:hypothetical protein
MGFNSAFKGLMKYFQQYVTSTNYNSWLENKFMKRIVTGIKEPTLVVVIWKEFIAERISSIASADNNLDRH